MTYQPSPIELGPTLSCNPNPLIKDMLATPYLVNFCPFSDLYSLGCVHIYIYRFNLWGPSSVLPIQLEGSRKAPQTFQTEVGGWFHQVVHIKTEEKHLKINEASISIIHVQHHDRVCLLSSEPHGDFCASDQVPPEGSQAHSSRACKCLQL